MAGREVPNIDVLYELFLPTASIVKAVGGVLEAMDVRTFVEPRRALLTGGTIENFREYETSAKTEIFGSIAQRFSHYEKTWVASGVERRGSGAKSIQFVQTRAGWKIAALVWDDSE